MADCNAVIENCAYDIQYQITGGTLDDLYGDPDSATITAEISADGEGGKLIIQLPRHIDAKDEDGEDLFSLTKKGEMQAGNLIYEIQS